MIIESTQNQYVKRLRALAGRKGRREHGEFLVEGVRALEDAVAAGAGISYVAHCAELASADRARELAERLAAEAYRLMEVTEQVFRSFSQVQAPEGLAAAVAIPKVTLDDLPGDADLLLAAVDLRDPGNMGTLVRLADAVGADGLIAAGTCVDLYEPKVVRATAGSVFHLPLVQDVTADEVLHWAGARQICTVATALEAEPWAEIRYPQRVLVLLGGEAHGLDEELAERADLQVAIPMPGRAESLNVAVAAGIVAYEILRHREYNSDEDGEGGAG